MTLTPDELASSRGHKLGKVSDVGHGKYVVRSCRRCGARLVVAQGNGSFFGLAVESDCARSDGPEAA